MPESVPVDRFTWERALRRDPSVTGTRYLVLLTVGTYMGPDGTGARPSQAAIAEATGLGERAVRKHLTTAVNEGWLVRTQRGHRISAERSVTSTYRASVAQPAPTDRLEDDPTGTPVPVDDGANRHPRAASTGENGSQPARNDDPTGTPVPPTMQDHSLTSHARSTHEDEASRRVTRRILWATMAERQLANQREAGWPDMPPPGSYREERYLEKLRSEFENQHGERVLKLRDRLPPADLERWLYELDPSLSKHGYGPAMLLGERQWAEYRASVGPPMTDDELTRVHQRTLETKARLRRMQAERRERDQVSA